MRAGEYRFGRFTLRLAGKQFADGGAPQRLGERGFALLLALVENADRVLPREELFQRASFLPSRAA